MPIVDSNYHKPIWLPERHAETIVPALFRKVKGVHYDRERIGTFDRDFLDLDWSRVGSSKLVIISHGLEGNSYQEYILGMVKAINKANWDVLAWNFRSCSGEMNNKVRFYRADSTEDLDWVIKHAQKIGKYDEIALIGFSLGGCLSLKLLGELGSSATSRISKAIAFSVPCDLIACVKALSFGFNRFIYLRRFLTMLKNKLVLKIRQFPDLLSYLDVNKIRRFEDFDTYFTAPLYGFKDAYDYYERSSCKKNIPNIRVPTLIVNARNDPFLHPDCQPILECQENSWVNLEMPKEGGHVGFMLSTINGPYWSEQRAVEYLEAS